MAWDDIHEPGSPQDRFRKRGGQGGGPGNGGERGPQMQMPQFKMPNLNPGTILIGVVVLLGLWILPSAFYFVEQDEEGVVTLFGK